MFWRVFPILTIILLIFLFATRVIDSFDKLEDTGRVAATITVFSDGKKTAPELAAIPLYEESEFVNIASLEGKKYILLNFFASWCRPCLKEHPLLVELSEDQKLRGKLYIYGVGWKDKRERLQNFLNKNGNPYDSVVMDNHSKTAIAYGLTGVPESFLIDREGNIVMHVAGILTKVAVEKISAEILSRETDK